MNENLISKRLRRYSRKCITERLDPDFADAVVEAAKMLDASRPVVRGKWILDEDPHDGDCRCSACRVAIAQMHERNHKLLNILTGGEWWKFYNYCPNCGAKMWEGEE